MAKRYDLFVSRKDDSGKAFYTKVGVAFYSPDKDVISIKIDENISISREAVCFLPKPKEERGAGKDPKWVGGEDEGRF